MQSIFVCPICNWMTSRASFSARTGITSFRTFVLKVQQPEGARRFLGSLVTGESATGKPHFATATDLTVKPDYCINVGLTHGGLKALQVPPASLASFPEEFIKGAVARAERIGDAAVSAPENWKDGLAE